MGVIRETQQYNLISPENGRVGYQSNKGMPQYESIQQYSAISPEDRYRGYQWKVTPQYESTQQCNVLSIEDDFNGTHVETTKRNIFFRNFLMPLGCFDCLDDILLFSLFRDDADLERTGFHFNGGEQVEVEVKATIVTRSNDRMTSELTSFDVEKKLAETHFVGQVCKVGKESEKRQWTTVTSLRKCAMIARCVTVPEESLVPIPPKLDAGEAVAIVSNYLPAFGALYHGSEKHKKRFSRSALIKKKVLVTGGGTNAAEAVVKLAVLGGASKVFLLNSNKALTACHVGSHKVVSLSDDPDEWISRVRGSVDVIIDLEYPKNFDAIKSVMSMSRNGRLVTCRSSEKAEDHGWAANIKQAATQASLLMVPGATIYDFDSICENNCGEVVKDLNYLFRLLEKRKLRPSIDKYIKITDVSIVREDMAQHPAVGAVVCEPWRD